MRLVNGTENCVFNYTFTTKTLQRNLFELSQPLIQELNEYMHSGLMTHGLLIPFEHVY